MKPVRKNPFRHLYYFALLFRTEFLFGGAARRRYFVSRLVDRIALKFRLYVVPKFFFMAFHAARSAMVPAGVGDLLWRYRLWYWATAQLGERETLRSWVMDRKTGGPKVIVIGTGSIGDVLQITPVLRALRETLPTAQIALLHRSLVVKKILDGNKNVDLIVQEADFYAFGQIKQAVAEEGAADLVVDIASVTYIITYTRAPKALRHPELDRTLPDDFFVKAKLALALWANPPPVTLDATTKSVWPHKWRGIHFLDVLGTTGNLPITHDSDLDFHVEPADEQILQRISRDRPFVTVQNGVDTDVMNWSRTTGQYPTKLLPLVTWKETVRLLGERGFMVVQLGGLDDTLIDGVALDLRGQTSFREAAVILKHALCHVGTEGGLVHLSRAMHGKSVVLFGPTAVDFFGYPGNINLLASDCTGCWRSKRDWYIYCPRGFSEAECMLAHRAENIVDAVCGLSR